MKKPILVLLFLVVFSAVAFAQSEPVYTVQKGDTLWTLSGDYLGNPLKWGELLGLNPFLKEPGRQWLLPDHRLVVLIKPGEQLAGLEQIGVTAEALPLSELKAEAGISEPFVYSGWFWAAILAGAYALYRTRWRFENPITSGLPIIEGGIPPESPRNVEERFQRIAERRYGEVNPGANLSVERPVRIGEIESGYLSGDGVVQYRDRRERRRMRHDPAYRANFRFPDRREEVLYFLQGCANDVTFYGTRYKGFEWQSGETVAPAPQTVREPLRAVGRAGEVVDAIPMPMTTVTIAGLRMVVPEGASVRVGEKKEISISVSHACDITIGHVKKAKAVKKAKPAAASGAAS